MHCNIYRIMLEPEAFLQSSGRGNLVPRVLSYPRSVGRIGENPGNEVAAEG